MQRRATKNTRGRNSYEKSFQGFIKESDCGYCGATGPSIVDHSMGATFKHNKVLVGHWFVTPKCKPCDDIKTQGNRKWHNELTGKTETQCWLDKILEYAGPVPDDVIESIKDWNR